MKFNQILNEKRIIIERNEAQIRQDWEGLRGVFNSFSKNPATLKQQINQWLGNMEGIDSVEKIDDLIKNIKKDKTIRNKKWDRIDDWLYQYLKTHTAEILSQRAAEKQSADTAAQRKSDIRANTRVDQVYGV